ncbi:MAG: SDR family oxidoreductase [Phycisphaerales bacterium]|nr:SDR family oxidoreductase [Phycisphaerales bacterium]
MQTPLKSTLLKNRIAVVTGASAGIGEAIAREIVSHGGPTVLNARREARLHELIGELGPEDITAVAGDASSESVIERMLDVARHTFGAGHRDADLVVVNAGRGLNGSVMTSDTAQWEEMVRTNLLGAARLIRAAGLRMLKVVPDAEINQKGAWLKSPRDIIVIGSTVGRNVSPFSSMYGATKFGVHGLVEGARRELGPKGIRVTLIEPAFVRSEFQGVAGYDPKWIEGVWERIGPVLEPADIARMVSFIAGQPAGVHVSDILVRPTRQDYP